jgi:hypothetical protein
MLHPLNAEAVVGGANDARDLDRYLRLADLGERIVAASVVVEGERTFVGDVVVGGEPILAQTTGSAGMPRTSVMKRARCQAISGSVGR